MCICVCVWVCVCVSVGVGVGMWVCWHKACLVFGFVQLPFASQRRVSGHYGGMGT